MSEPFIGEIRMFAGNFAPQGWAFCDGQVLSIADNDALFSLFGTAYGGDGTNTFGLPDLRGRLPVHAGTGPGLSPRQIGARDGAEQVTVVAAELPSHTLGLLASSQAATDALPQGKVLAQTDSPLYGVDTPFIDMNNDADTTVGGSQPHTNLMPFLCVNFIVALFGIYPSRN